MKTIQITKKMIEKSLLQDAVYTIQEVLKSVGDDTYISLEKGNYDLRRTYAYQEECYVSNNDSGLKSIAFYLKGKNNIVIDGNGSFLNGIGRIIPFYLTECSNVTIKNFVIDYQRPFTSQGEVLESTHNSAVLKIDKQEFPYEIKHGILQFVGEDYHSDFVHGLLEFYKDEKRPVCDVFDNTINTGLCADELGQDTVRIYHKFCKQPVVGNILTIKHEERLVCGIVIDRCESTLIEHIWIKQAGTMGVIGQLSKDITINHVDIYPDEKSVRVFSINADATHFVNCCGTVIVENSRLESMFDDIINVHGNYVRVSKVIDPTHIMVEIPHIQQVGFFNFMKGNRIEICDKDTMMSLGTSVVKSYIEINKKYYVMEIENSYSFEENATYCINNLDLYPKVIFRNNVCGKNRARGLLLTSTQETIIEHNVIDSEGSAIKVNSDMRNWYESGAISKVVIKNNRMTRKNHRNWGTALIDIDPGMDRKMDGLHYHGEMIIENNEILLEKSPLFFGYSFQKVSIEKNKIILKGTCKDADQETLISARNYGELVVNDNEWVENWYE